MSRWTFNLHIHLTAVLLSSLLAGCGTTAYVQQTESSKPLSEPDSSVLPTKVGDEIALRAISLVGKPYRYGGADLHGFDCSGLVYYIHQALGLAVPRTAADQQRAAISVDRTDLLPGDLLFFKTTSSKYISHVGIYVGENRFVHAPQSGKLIELRTLDDEYYGSRLAGSGRLYGPS
ncbi:MAG: C40 family peptidase [Steroidobacteraceae bacterium]